MRTSETGVVAKARQLEALILSMIEAKLATQIAYVLDYGLVSEEREGSERTELELLDPIFRGEQGPDWIGLG